MARNDELEAQSEGRELERSAKAIVSTLKLLFLLAGISSGIAACSPPAETTPTPVNPTPTHETSATATELAPGLERDGTAIKVQPEQIQSFGGLQESLSDIHLTLVGTEEQWNDQTFTSNDGKHAWHFMDVMDAEGAPAIIMTHENKETGESTISFGFRGEVEMQAVKDAQENLGETAGWPLDPQEIVDVMATGDTSVVYKQGLRTVFPNGSGKLIVLSDAPAFVGLDFREAGAVTVGANGEIQVTFGDEKVLFFSNWAEGNKILTDVEEQDVSSGLQLEAAELQAGITLGVDVDRVEVHENTLFAFTEDGELPAGVLVEGKWVSFKEYQLDIQFEDLGLPEGASVRADGVVVDRDGVAIEGIVWNETEGNWERLVDEEKVIEEAINAMPVESLGLPEGSTIRADGVALDAQGNEITDEAILTQYRAIREKVHQIIENTKNIKEDAGGGIGKVYVRDESYLKNNPSAKAEFIRVLMYNYGGWSVEQSIDGQKHTLLYGIFGQLKEGEGELQTDGVVFDVGVVLPDGGFWGPAKGVWNSDKTAVSQVMTSFDNFNERSTGKLLALDIPINEGYSSVIAAGYSGAYEDFKVDRYNVNLPSYKASVDVLEGSTLNLSNEDLFMLWNILEPPAVR